MMIRMDKLENHHLGLLFNLGEWRENGKEMRVGSWDCERERFQMRERVKRIESEWGELWVRSREVGN